MSFEPIVVDMEIEEVSEVVDMELSEAIVVESKLIEFTTTKSLPVFGDISWASGSEIIVHCSNTSNGNINGIFYVGSGAKKITVYSSSGYTNLSNAFRQQADVEEIILPSSFNSYGNLYCTFYYCSKLKKVSGTPLLSLSTQDSGVQNIFAGCSNLEEVRFVENCIKVTIDLSACSKLTNDTLISVANGLFEGVTGKTVRFHSTPKSRLQNIMGDSVLDESETYHVFVESESGSMTLQNFINSVKAWSI